MVFLWAWYSAIQAESVVERAQKPLQQMNLKHFSHISSRAESAKKILMDTQAIMLSTGIMCDDYMAIKQNAERLLEIESLFIAQKAKCKFLKEGDLCTKFSMT